MAEGAPRIAVVGCGAIVESFHLPALRRHPEVASRLVFVDPAAERARALADSVGSGAFAADLGEVLGEVSGTIVATPHHLHHPMTMRCVGAGVPVLCEKPLAGSAAEAEEIARAAAAAGVAVCVNQTRRLFPTFRRVREAIEAGELGALRRVEISLGEVFDWPSASGFYFSRQSPPRGVLLDTGAHMVDLACWWLGARPALVRYQDDSFGGKEAVCRLEFAHGACSGEIHLSWLSKLENRFRVEGEKATLEGEIYEWRRLSRTEGGRRRELRVPSPVGRIEEFGELLIDNFLEVVAGRARPLVGPEDAVASIGLIEECYAHRQRFAMPWFETFAAEGAGGV